MVTVGDDPLLGVIVEGRYKIESVIGQGSAGTVYKAVQELIGREVAIKVLHDYLVSDQEFIKRFTQEAKASSRLSHPNIITIYDFGVIPQGGRPYIAMDLLKGTPLSDLLLERNHLSIDEAVPIFKQVCGALAEAHRQGVVHRDIKPENIVLVERSGQRLFPIVVDFGIARLVQEESDVARITRTGTVCGSPTYMSPEQCTSSKVDHRSDLYSLGVVIYETLTGEVPFLSDELVKVMAMHLSDPPKPLNQVRDDLRFPQALEEVVYKTLAKNPDQRYQTMEELSDALEESIKKEEPPPVMVAPPAAKRPDFTPGPLAQDDTLQQAAPRAPQMVQQPELPSGRKATQETVQAPSTTRPVSKAMDLASRALEELRSSGAYDDTGENGPPATATGSMVGGRGITSTSPGQYESVMASSVSNQAVSSRANYLHGRGKVKPTFFQQLFSFIQKLFILALLVVALGAGVIALAVYNPKIAQMLPFQLQFKAPVSEDVDTLVKQSKYEDACNQLREQMKKGKLTKAQADTYSTVAVTLAKQYARDKRYDDGIDILEDVQKGSKQYAQAQSLLKRYKAIQDK
jgi:serine/threonine protein kinase